MNCVTYNHNSRVLASAGDDSCVVLAHTENLEKLALLEPSNFSPCPVNSIAFTSKSDMLGCGALDGTVRIWDLRKKEVLTSFNHHTDSVSCVAWNYTDQQIASSSLSGEIVLHSLLTKVAVSNFKQRGSAGIKVIQFSPFKKQTLGSGSENGSVYIWDCTSRSVVCSFPNFHNSPVTGLAFSSVNHMLMCTSGLDQRIQFYDTQDKKLVKTIEVDAPLTCISFCSDGHTLAGGTLYGTVLLYDLRNPVNAKNVLKGHEGNAVNWVDFAKAKDVKPRVAREGSREPVSSSRPEPRGVRENSRDPVSSSRPEETAPIVSRFKTIEEIKLEAKLRVEQKRRERMKEEPVTDPQKDFASAKPIPMNPKPSIDARESTKSPTPSKEIMPNPSLISLVPVNTNISPLNNKTEVNNHTPTSPAVTPKTNNSPIRMFSSTLLENDQSKTVLELVESRLNLQDDAIFEIKEDIQNLHVEIIRQFMIQIVNFIQ